MSIKNPCITKTIVEKRIDNRQSIGEAEARAVARHQAALKALDRLDKEQQLCPHRPRLANDVLRRDDMTDAVDRVMQAIEAISGPLPKSGPRTASHPMATRQRPEPRPPMATRLRPTRIRAEIINTLMSIGLIVASIVIAIYLASA